MRRVLLIGLVLAVVFVAGPGLAGVSTEEIILPGASGAEGIATGTGSTFYAGDLFTGDIFRGDLRGGDAEVFIDAPSGRAAAGLKADVGSNLLFVAGAFTGQGYVYDLSTGA